MLRHLSRLIIKEWLCHFLRRLLQFSSHKGQGKHNQMPKVPMQKSPSKAFFFLHSVLEKIQQQHCYVFHHFLSFKLTRAQISTSHITSETCIFLLFTSVKDSSAGVAQILTEDKTGSDGPQALQPTHQHHKEQVGSSLQLPAGQPVLPHLAVHYTAGRA